jgi:hypothetical protein
MSAIIAPLGPRSTTRLIISRRASRPYGPLHIQHDADSHSHTPADGGSSNSRYDGGNNSSSSSDSGSSSSGYDSGSSSSFDSGSSWSNYPLGRGSLPSFGRTARSPEDRYAADATPRPTRGRGTRTNSAAQGPCRRRRYWRCRRRQASPGPATRPAPPYSEAGLAQQESPLAATGPAGTDNRPQPAGPAEFPQRSGGRSNP